MNKMSFQTKPNTISAADLKPISKCRLILDILLDEAQNTANRFLPDTLRAEYHFIAAQKAVQQAVCAYRYYGIDNLLDSMTRLIMRDLVDISFDAWDKIVEVDANVEIE